MIMRKSDIFFLQDISLPPTEAVREVPQDVFGSVAFYVYVSDDVSHRASIHKWRKRWQVEKEVVEEERLAGAVRLCFSGLMTHLTAHREKALRQHRGV